MNDTHANAIKLNISIFKQNAITISIFTQSPMMRIEKCDTIYGLSFKYFSIIISVEERFRMPIIIDLVWL